jgi:hypothetical protein
MHIQYAPVYKAQFYILYAETVVVRSDGLDEEDSAAKLQSMEVGEQVVHLAFSKNAFVAWHIVAASVDGLFHNVVIGGTSAGQEWFAVNTRHAWARERTFGICEVAVATGLGVKPLTTLFGLGERTSNIKWFLFAGGENEQGEPTEDESTTF